MQYVRDNIAVVGQGCLHLFKPISFYGYKPTQGDIELLEEWLQTPLDGHLAQLAQYFIEHLNWQWNHDTQELFLEPATHRAMALMLGRVRFIVAINSADYICRVLCITADVRSHYPYLAIKPPN